MFSAYFDVDNSSSDDTGAQVKLRLLCDNLVFILIGEAILLQVFQKMPNILYS